MKYNININQEVMSKVEGLTFRDACVIDWLNGMFGSDSDKIVNKRMNGFTWISLPHLIEDMPLLRIETSSAGSKLINRIKKMGLIETKTDRKDRKLYAKPTSLMRSIYFGKSNKTLCQVQMETSQVQMDTNQYTSINTLTNPLPPKVESTVKEVKEYNYKEELDKLINSTWKPNKIIYLYFMKKKFNFQNKEQFTAEYKRNLRVAKDLEGYNSLQIEQTMNYLEEQGLTWTLNAIGRNISNVVNKQQ